MTNATPTWPLTCVFGAPGRTRTCNLLFRRCLGLDAVPEHEGPGHQRAWSESYPLVLAAVLSSRCCVPADRADGLGGTGPVGWQLPVCLVDRLGPQGRLGCWALAHGECRPG